MYFKIYFLFQWLNVLKLQKNKKKNLFITMPTGNYNFNSSNISPIFKCDKSQKYIYYIVLKMAIFI